MFEQGGEEGKRKGVICVFKEDGVMGGVKTFLEQKKKEGGKKEWEKPGRR